MFFMNKRLQIVMTSPAWFSNPVDRSFLFEKQPTEDCSSHSKKCYFTTCMSRCKSNRQLHFFPSISTCVLKTGRWKQLCSDSLLLILLFIIAQFYIISQQDTVIVKETLNAYRRSMVLNTPASFPAGESWHVADSGEVPLGGRCGCHCWAEVQKKACRALGSSLPLPWQPRRCCCCDWCTASKQPEYFMEDFWSTELWNLS